ncbi:MAG: hypothetical protein K0R00_85 [Herbinix sp.]|jgi:hypothetical protein|nr:hypothetical protein [Herbinix sp.]
METRQITEVRLCILKLNMMRNEHVENVDIAAISTSLTALQNWYESLLVPVYKEPDEGICGPRTLCKSFRKGSPLEYYNPISWGHGGISSQWVPIDSLSEIRSQFYFVEEGGFN